jgi:aryl-alcohol dehydrogenase-like predicted oxidoreductase
MLWRVIEAEVVPACEELGLGQIVWSPVAQGVLTGKYQPGQVLPAESRAVGPEPGSLEARVLNDETLTAVQGVLPIAADLGLTPAQLAIAWVLRNPNVSSAIIGASRPEQVAENAKASGIVLPADAIDAIDVALGSIVQTDPRLTSSPNPRP